jgi:hypothetical protein
METQVAVNKDIAADSIRPALSLAWGYGSKD